MIRKILLISTILGGCHYTFAQNGSVGIGTSTPHASALVDMSSTSKGLLIPRLTTAQRDAIIPKPEGLIIYNTDDHCLQYWNATAWFSNCSPAAAVAAVNCGSASFNPNTITAGTPYTGTIIVPYTGGNGQSYGAGNPVASTGIPGLTANRQAGTLTTGSGNIIYNVTGTPTGTGTTAFPINFDGASSCSTTHNVTGTTPPAADLTASCTGFMLPYTTNGGNASGTVSGLPVTASFSAYTGISATGGPGSCNVTLVGSSNFRLGTNTSSMKISFNRGVSNLKVYVGVTNAGENFTFALKRAGATVSPTYTISSAGTCNSNWNINTGTNTVSCNAGTSANPSAIIFNIGGVWFDEIVISEPAIGNGSIFNFCVGAAQ
jgi:hypothetical protein